MICHHWFTVTVQSLQNTSSKQIFSIYSGTNQSQACSLIIGHNYRLYSLCHVICHHSIDCPHSQAMWVTLRVSPTQIYWFLCGILTRRSQVHVLRPVGKSFALFCSPSDPYATSVGALAAAAVWVCTGKLCFVSDKTEFWKSMSDLAKGKENEVWLALFEAACGTDG